MFAVCFYLQRLASRPDQSIEGQKRMTHDKGWLTDILDKFKVRKLILTGKKVGRL